MAIDGKPASAPAEFVAPPQQDLGFGIIRSMRKQKAWYFQRKGADKFGKDQFCTASLILCRWDDCVDYNIMPDARLVDASATVYVDRQVREGDVLMLARDDVTEASEAPVIDISSQVVKTKTIPNIRNTAKLYIAMLS